METLDLKKNELYTIADQPDPTGTGQVGRAATIHLDRHPLARTMVRWKDMLLEVDLYPLADADAAGALEILIFCPRCRHQLRIDSRRKAVEFDLHKTPAWVTDAGLALATVVQGTISIEPFSCTWELEDGHGRKDFGMSLCRWSVAIDGNVARDA